MNSKKDVALIFIASRLLFHRVPFVRWTNNVQSPDVNIRNVKYLKLLQFNAKQNREITNPGRGLKMHRFFCSKIFSQQRRYLYLSRVTCKNVGTCLSCDWIYDGFEDRSNNSVKRDAQCNLSRRFVELWTFQVKTSVTTRDVFSKCNLNKLVAM